MKTIIITLALILTACGGGGSIDEPEIMPVARHSPQEYVPVSVVADQEKDK